jgi:hypothetical protein
MLGYSPTVTGYFCNCLRSVSEPYIRGVIPSLKLEREHLLFPHTVEFTVAWPLTAPSEKVLNPPCCWGMQCATSQHTTRKAPLNKISINLCHVCYHLVPCAQYACWSSLSEFIHLILLLWFSSKKRCSNLIGLLWNKKLEKLTDYSLRP